MTRRKRVIAAVVLATAGVAGAVGGRAWAVRHVREVTGSEPLGTPSCLSCHRGGGPARYVRGQVRPQPIDLAADPRGRLVYAATGAHGRVAVLDARAGVLLRWIEVPGEASGVAVSPAGDRVAVSLGDRGAVALVDAETDRVVAEIAVGLEPKGVAFAGNGTTLVVANAGAGTASVVDVASAAERFRVPAGRDPYRVAVSPDGGRVAVVARMASLTRPEETPSSELTILDGAGRVVRRLALPSCHLAEGVTFTHDGARVLVPILRARNLLPVTQVARGWVMSSVLASVDPATGEVALLPLQTTNRMFADPAGVAVTPDGRSAFVAASGANQVGRLDLSAALAAESECRPAALERFALARTWMRGRTDVAGMPGDVEVVGRDEGARVAVAERLGDSVALLDPATGALLARVALGPSEEPDAPRRGIAVFNSASYAFQGAFSCRGCHPDGSTDGLTYDFEIDGLGRDVVLNRDLRGVQGTAPFKWNGRNATLQRQCGARFAMVLTRADPIPEPQLDDLVAYLESLPPPGAPAGPDPVQASAARTTAIERGRAIFFRTTTKKGAPIPETNLCATCHPPPHYSTLEAADVGTGTPFDTAPSFDVPHLTGVGRKAPFLHDGRARSLEEVWTLPGVEDRHGQVTDLNKSELNDLIEFLRSL